MRIIKEPEERKAEIIQTARRLFVEKGVENTKISDIVDAVGVAQGLFYYYFKSKKEIITLVVKQIITELDDQVYLILRNKEIDFYQKIMQFIDLYAKAFSRFQPDTDVQNILGERIVQDIDRQILKHLRELARMGKEEKVLSSHYSEEMIIMLFYGMNKLKEISSSKVMDRDMVKHLLEYCLRLPIGCLQ